MSTDGVVGAAYIPTDGYIDPSQLTYALADGARRGGCAIHTSTRVTGIAVRDGRVTGVVTDRGAVEAEVVVLAGGMYAAELGRLAGVRIPIVPMAHEYVVTAPFRERDAGEHLPTLRDPDLLVYFREEGGGLVMGGYERPCAPWSLTGPGGLDAIPPSFNGQLLQGDPDRLDEIVANAQRRVPAMADARVSALINGPEAFTPDGEFCLGETEVAGLFCAAGFCAHGLAGAGGIGKVMAEWIAGGEPALDLWDMDIRRFGRHYRSPSYTLARAREVYETYYDVKYPGHERQAGRPLRVSPAYGWHAEHDAVFGEKSGWERVNYYASNAAAGAERLRPRGWAGELWSPAIGAEHLATRERAGLFDESSFAKLAVTGPGAAAFLERLCDNRVARDPGRVTYTQMLNRRGGIESDFTVTRLGDEQFQIVTGTAFGQHDLSWLRRHAPADGSVRVDDVTAAWACFALWGPLAREILQPLTPSSLTNADFPYLTAQETVVADVPVRALRVTFVGELGWELYCPAEYGAALWRALWAAGEPLGMVAGGYRAIDTLRLEKGYRLWAADITPDDTPHEAGLSFCVRDDKDFVGRDALDGARPGRRLRCLVLEDARSVVLGNEPVRVGGTLAGRVTSGGYGFSVERSIAYAYLPPDAGPGTPVEVEVFGRWIPGAVAAEPLFDPRGERIRA
jgi:4-methylaminobutanoate oxidase (formaldehyde-forming)